jgi:sugar phosphate permease
MGCISDILPMRSPIFEIGIFLSTLMLYLVNHAKENEELRLKVITFILGAAITGSTIIIAAIECDLGVYVRRKYKKEALGTFSGMIDGFASVGGVLG